MTKTKTIDFNKTSFHSELCKVRAIAKNPKNENLAVGFRGGEIIEIEPSTQKIKVVGRGHYDHELWGLTIHPSKAEFVTVGQDFLLAKWDINTMKQVKHAH